MKFRTAHLVDLPQLNTISVQSKSHWGYPQSWIEHWKEDLTLDEEKISTQNILVAENADQIIGFCSIAENSENYEILHLWVLPQFIGQGYGKELLKNAQDEFVKKEKPVVVEADPNAEPFYRNQGFVTFDKVESFPKGRFLPLMRKN